MRVIVAALFRGSYPALDFLRMLAKERKADAIKTQALLDRAADHWPIVNREKFKQVDGPLFEFKSFQVRLLCFQQPPDLVVITHGVIKKKDELRKEDIERAYDIKKEHDATWDPESRSYRKGVKQS